MLLMTFAIILALALLRALTNTFRFLATRHYYSKFKLAPESMSRYSEPIGKLFLMAATERTVARINNNFPVKVLEHEPLSRNLANPLHKSVANETFENTLSVYWYRIRESFYPMFWVLLPEHIFNYCGIQLPSIIQILINVVYWLMSFGAGYALEIFLDSHFPVDLLEAIQNIAK